MKLRVLTKKLVDCRKLKKEHEDAVKELNSEMEGIELQMIQEMEQAGIQSVKYEDLGNPYIMEQQFPRVVDQTKFYKYLEKTGQDGMIKRTINANTLRSWWTNTEEPIDPKKVGLEVFVKTKIGIKGVK